jgi:Xaa-Pro aminopeptidase
MAVTPALDAALFRSRRDEVLRRLRAAGGGVLLLPSTPVARRNGDADHPYRCDSDLFWLTGFEEPEAVAALSTHGDRPLTLFVRPRDKEREIWNGRRAGVKGAVEAFGADQAFEIEKLDAELPKLLLGAPALWYRLGGHDEAFDLRVARLLASMRARARAFGDPPARIEDPGQVLHELRLRKDPVELRSLRKAVELTRRGHLAAMVAGRPGAHEYELQALLEREYRGGGGRGWGYYPIVAAGSNATVLHYHENEAAIREGELVLVDSGAEVDLYTADVTRTFPAGGRFTPLQRRAYEVVLHAADDCIAHAGPGATIDQLHERAVRALTGGMVELGLLRGSVDELIEQAAFRRYYMHRTSHWLGLDVHDAGSYRGQDGRARPLEPGMVFTVEPGLYVDPEDDRAPAELRGLGIRIEDDVLVTEQGCENLTASIPRAAADVEAACAR